MDLCLSKFYGSEHGSEWNTNKCSIFHCWVNPTGDLPSFIKFYSCISSSESLVRSSVERIPFDDYLVRRSLWSAEQHAGISIYIKLVLLFRSIPIESFLFRCSVPGMQREQSKVPNSYQLVFRDVWIAPELRTVRVFQSMFALSQPSVDYSESQYLSLSSCSRFPEKVFVWLVFWKGQSTRCWFDESD